MAKKKPKRKAGDSEEAALPKFSGWGALAAGLGDIKAKLDEDKRKADEDKRKADLARVAAGKKPLPLPAKAPAPRPVDVTRDGDDEHAFHRMMSGVVPLEGRGSRVPVAGSSRIDAKAKPVDLQTKAREEAKNVLEHLHHLVDDGVRFEVTDDGKRVEGRRIDVPPSLLRELRRGNLPIDGRLDLHGLGPEAAREQVLQFLKAQRVRGERCVLVIHGKGDGVLRGEISAWLSQGRAREHVAAFATAQQEDGGEGAVYVALRR